MPFGSLQGVFPRREHRDNGHRGFPPFPLPAPRGSGRGQGGSAGTSAPCAAPSPGGQGRPSKRGGGEHARIRHTCEAHAGTHTRTPGLGGRRGGGSRGLQLLGGALATQVVPSSSSG